LLTVKLHLTDGLTDRPSDRLFHTHANYSRERSRSSFGLSIHTHANANVRANCSREQFASFALSNAIRANNLRMKSIFD